MLAFNLVILACVPGYITGTFAPQIGTVQCFRQYMDITIEGYGGRATVVDNEGNSNCVREQFPWTVRVYTMAASQQLTRPCVTSDPEETADDPDLVQYSTGVHFIEGATIVVDEQTHYFTCTLDRELATHAIPNVTPIGGLTIISELSHQIPEMLVRFAQPKPGGNINGEYEVIEAASSGSRIFLFVEIEEPSQYIWESIRVSAIDHSNNAQFIQDPPNVNLQFYCKGCPDELDLLLGAPVFEQAEIYNSEPTTLIIPYLVLGIGSTNEVHLRVHIDICDAEDADRCDLSQDECPIEPYEPCYGLRAADGGGQMRDESKHSARAYATIQRTVMLRIE